MKIIVTVTLTILFSACSSIDKTDEIKQFTYLVGQTTKSEVIEALGLPDTSVVKDDVHLLGYRGEADGSDLFISMPIAATQVTPTTTTVFFTDIGPETRAELNKMDIVFLFNKNGVLTNAIKPE